MLTLLRYKHCPMIQNMLYLLLILRIFPLCKSSFLLWLKRYLIVNQQ
uniref:Uncharacterized protein n=1 Tax=Anguilla anguilla TaxID=7936 RepID=A0A0E9SEC9_ANGAN